MPELNNPFDGLEMGADGSLKKELSPAEKQEVKDALGKFADQVRDVRIAIEKKDREGKVDEAFKLAQEFSTDFLPNVLAYAVDKKIKQLPDDVGEKIQTFGALVSPEDPNQKKDLTDFWAFFDSFESFLRNADYSEIEEPNFSTGQVETAPVKKRTRAERREKNKKKETEAEPTPQQGDQPTTPPNPPVPTTEAVQAGKDVPPPPESNEKPVKLGFDHLQAMLMLYQVEHKEIKLKNDTEEAVYSIDEIKEIFNRRLKEFTSTDFKKKPEQKRHNLIQDFISVFPKTLGYGAYEIFVSHDIDTGIKNPGAYFRLPKPDRPEGKAREQETREPQWGNDIVFTPEEQAVINDAESYIKSITGDDSKELARIFDIRKKQSEDELEAAVQAKFKEVLITRIRQFKDEKFRAGFIKKEGRGDRFIAHVREFIRAFPQAIADKVEEILHRLNIPTQQERPKPQKPPEAERPPEKKVQTYDEVRKEIFGNLTVDSIATRETLLAFAKNSDDKLAPLSDGQSYKALSPLIETFFAECAKESFTQAQPHEKLGIVDRYLSPIKNQKIRAALVLILKNENIFDAEPEFKKFKEKEEALHRVKKRVRQHTKTGGAIVPPGLSQQDLEDGLYPIQRNGQQESTSSKQSPESDDSKPESGKTNASPRSEEKPAQPQPPGENPNEIIKKIRRKEGGVKKKSSTMQSNETKREEQNPIEQAREGLDNGKKALELLHTDDRFAEFLHDFLKNDDLLTHIEAPEHRASLVTAFDRFQKMEEAKNGLIEAAALMFAEKTALPKETLLEAFTQGDQAKEVADYVYQQALEKGERFNELMAEVQLSKLLPETIKLQEKQLEDLGAESLVRSNLDTLKADIELLAHAEKTNGSFQSVLAFVEKAMNGFSTPEQAYADAQHVDQKRVDEIKTLADQRKASVRKDVETILNSLKPENSEERDATIKQFDAAIAAIDKDTAEKIEKVKAFRAQEVAESNTHRTREQARLKVQEKYGVKTTFFNNTEVRTKLAELREQAKNLEKTLGTIEQIKLSKQDTENKFNGIKQFIFDKIKPLQALDAVAIAEAKKILSVIDSPDASAETLEEVDEYIANLITASAERRVGASPLEGQNITELTAKIGGKVKEAVVKELFELASQDELFKGDVKAGKEHPFVEAAVKLLTKGMRKDQIGSKKGEERLKLIEGVILQVMKDAEDKKIPGWRAKKTRLGLALTAVRKKAIVPPPLPVDQSKA